MELLNKKEVLELIKDFKEKETGTFTKGYNKAVRDIYNTVKSGQAVKSIENNGWIPVEERLPEKDGYYLTCDKRGNIHVFYHHKSMEYPFGICPNHSQYYQPIAWQPLPPAYRKE